MNYNFSLIKDIKEEGLRQIFILIPLIWVIIKYFQNGYPDSSSFDSWFFNSDSIFYHSVSKDLISNKGKLIDWYFPAAPSLFPSLLLVYIINLFTENIYFNNIVFVLFQALHLYILLYFLLKHFTDKRYAFFFSFVIFSFTLIIFDFVPFLYYSKVDHHFGNFLNLLFCLILTINLLYKSNNLIAIGLFALLTISTISNPLIMAQFSLPIIITLFFIEKIKKDNRLKLFLIIISSSITGYLIMGLFFNNNLTDVNISYDIVINSIYHIKIFFTQICTIYQNVIILPFIYFLFFSGMILLNRAKKPNVLNQLLILFVSFSFITSTTVVLFSPVNIQFRYIINIYYLSIITTIILLYPYLSVFFKLDTTFVLRYFYMLLILITVFKTDWSKQLSFNYYPDYVSYFDKIVNEKKLEYGIADYWEANRLYVLSKSELKGIAPVRIDDSNNAIIRKFNTSRSWINKEFDFSYNINPKKIGLTSFDRYIANNDTVYVFK